MNFLGIAIQPATILAVGFRGADPVHATLPVKVMPTVETVLASDFVLLHGNAFPSSAELVEKIDATRALQPTRTIPVLVNEDDHNDFEDTEGRLSSCVVEHVSWGWFDWRRKGESFEERYQSVPVNWQIISERKRRFFRQVAVITGSALSLPARSKAP